MKTKGSRAERDRGGGGGERKGQWCRTGPLTTCRGARGVRGPTCIYRKERSVVPDWGPCPTCITAVSRALPPSLPPEATAGPTACISAWQASSSAGDRPRPASAAPTGKQRRAAAEAPHSRSKSSMASAVSSAAPRNARPRIVRSKRNTAASGPLTAPPPPVLPPVPPPVSPPVPPPVSPPAASLRLRSEANRSSESPPRAAAAPPAAPARPAAMHPASAAMSEVILCCISAAPRAEFRPAGARPPAGPAGDGPFLDPGDGPCPDPGPLPDPDPFSDPGLFIGPGRLLRRAGDGECAGTARAALQVG
eukprot:scaffold5977_cov103-Isochrysis_galbana.AAC.2